MSTPLPPGDPRPVDPRRAFHRRAAAASVDRALGAALANATDRLAAGRARLLAELPDSDALRAEARRIRAHTLATLDRQLAAFTEAAGRAGALVHWAATADDAVNAVRTIASSRGARTIVKSKSMVTEEIGLNRALQADGVRVVETDLGEFIVQLGDDEPSHIIVPVVHRTREQVAALFTEKLGATPDQVASIGAMTALARRTLRREFLAADIGISGANFLVADTGSVCLVTNEGNGRLSTSVPPVHVVVAGIERIVPTLDDLGVMLALLPRNATGQALTVYTSLITGPRRAAPGGAESDGPTELHIVLVDNGRSRVLGGELAEVLYCIRCGACLNHCPVYRAIGGHAFGSVYPGPIGSVVSPALFGIDCHGELAHASTLCGRCKEVCPVGIDLPSLMLRLRADTVDRRLAPTWLRAGVSLFARAATRPALFRTAGRAMAWAGRLLGRDGWIRRLPGPLSAWTASRDFPVPSARTFSAQWRERKGSR